jgi:hypothetical protein
MFLLLAQERKFADFVHIKSQAVGYNRQLSYHDLYLYAVVSTLSE